MDKLRMETPDLTAENVEKIAALFPNCVTEVVDEARSTDDTIVYKRGINFAVLKQMLSDAVVDGGEAYEFTWVGKKAAMVEANRPIRKTLRPCPEESKDWDTTENLYIEGDNLEVLKLLQESYLNKVKMIYIDPPYNTGNDFIYADDFMRTQDEENRQMGMFDEEENRLFKNTDSNGRFHSDWCSMMYSRLLLARNLLTEDGVIFISIDDNEVENLKKMCNEVYGENNFIAIINWKGRGGRQDSKFYAAVHEYILCYAKRKESFSAGEEIKTGDVYPKYDSIKNRYYKTQLLRKWGSNSRREDRPNLYYPIIAPDGTEVYPVVIEKNNRRPSNCEKFDGCWRHGASTMKENIKKGLVEFVKQPDGSWIPYEKIYEPLEGEEKTKKYTTWIDETNDGTKIVKDMFGTAVFDYPKSTSLIIRFLKMAGVEENDIVLDFFSGSATTAHAVMQLNAEDGGHRKFIMVQLPEVCDEKSEAAKAGYKTICDIGKERIRRAGAIIKKEYALAAPFEKTGQTAMYYDDMKPYMEEASTEFDAGFRVLKLDESNMKDVFYAPEELSQKTMYDMVSNIRDGRTGLDLLFGCLLDWGLPLSLPFSSETMDGCTVYTYNVDGGARIDLIACFDDNVPESVVTAIARRNPQRAVFRDGCFASSPEKINVVEIFKNYAPTCTVKVL